METKPLVLMVGVYDSKADAGTGYEDAKVLNCNGFFGIFDAAVITKDDHGTIHGNKDEKTTRQGAAASAGSGSRSNATSWEPQVSIDAPDGVDNLIRPLSVSG
jgi:uncharacterized membrane protein